MYTTVVPPSLVPGSDIHQKSVIHYSVVGVSISYLTPVRASCALVVPPVAEYFTALRKSCHITGQKDSCAQSERIPSNLQFSSSIVNTDPHCKNCFSCEVCEWYLTVTTQLPLSSQSPSSPYLTEELLLSVPVEPQLPPLSERFLISNPKAIVIDTVYIREWAVA